MSRPAIVVGMSAAVALIAVLAWLHDPAWLLTTTSGLHRWQADATGRRYRWMSPHATFFVPSTAQTIEIPLRAVFDTTADWPIVATITVDDRPVDRIVLPDSTWRQSTFRMPPTGGRRARRIDIRLDRARDIDRAVQLGEVSAR